mmetsp:Transcript_24586/g.58326  ORF Transcript_24586/g.58326 Transcript_24586/m.58326 type:complete len:277 (+) Transcript_24586:419-1249(+)
MDGSSSSSCKLPNYVGIALGITSQSWEDLGLDTSSDAAVAASEDIKVTAERITALLLIRVVAWIQPRGTFTDLSTTTICRHLLVNPDAFPTDSVNETVIRQLHSYVDAVLSGYQDVPYHSFKHCYHVTISTNKLIDLILQDSTPETARPPTTYGFRDDPLMQFCLLFSALVHDVDHRGIPNRQFANEDDELAIKYNDQSIAENHSLYLAFSELRPLTVSPHLFRSFLCLFVRQSYVVNVRFSLVFQRKKTHLGSKFRRKPNISRHQLFNANVSRST